MCLSVGRNCSKVDKVVKREICSVQTKGTKRYSFIDGDVQDSNSSFLLAVCEKVNFHWRSEKVFLTYYFMSQF